MNQEYFTAESVTIGHPDRMCDQFSDAILAAYVAQDPNARVAVECMGGHGKVWVCGEVTSNAEINIPSIIQKTYRDIGYKDELQIEVHLVKQSPDIARCVDTGGAGDQGIVIGYACDETPEFLPLEAALAHRLTDALTEARVSGRLPYLGPDGKSQVTVNPATGHVKAIVLSAQHDASVSIDRVRADLRELCFSVIPGLHVRCSSQSESGTRDPAYFISEDTQFFLNPAGPFIQGGFEADTGLTGRKLVVDFYGPRVPIGGGTTHGKDMTKTDRSGAMKAREKAIEILQEKGAKEVTVVYSYAIGIAGPIDERVVVNI